jgi:hypothetical protein
MLFVDGSNWLGALGRVVDGKIPEDWPDSRSFDFAVRAAATVSNIVLPAAPYEIRRHWFGSHPEQCACRIEIAERLREHRFDAHLFERHKRREKGVDIALTRKCSSTRSIRTMTLGCWWLAMQTTQTWSLT